ncbi:MAG: N-acetyltransferase [Chlorobiota bacterium]
MDIRLVPLSVEDPSERRQFIRLAWRFYRDDPNWVPPLKAEQDKLLAPRRNPFFHHARMQLWVAWHGAEPVGRIAAIVNELHNELHQDAVGFFGFFECVPDTGVARALLEAAAEWLRRQGKTSIRGPVNPSMNDECGLLVDGFDRPPAIMMPYNPPYYAELLEACGLQKAKDLLAYLLTEQFLSEKLRRGQQLVRERYRIWVRSMDFRDRRLFPQDVERIKLIYNRAWQPNWGFVRLTDAEMEFLVAGLKQVADPELALFAFRGEEPIGFALAIPDINQVLRFNRSGSLLGALWHLATKRKRIDAMRIMVLGILPEYQNLGADAVLYYELGMRGLRKGIRFAEASWVLEDNWAMRNPLEKTLGAQLYKRYRIYEMPI